MQLVTNRMEIRVLGKERNVLVAIKNDISAQTRSVQRVTELAEYAVLLAISELNVTELVSVVVVVTPDPERVKVAEVLMVEEGILGVGPRDGRGRRGRGHGRLQETNLVADGRHSEEPTRPVQHSPESAFTVKQLTGHERKRFDYLDSRRTDFVVVKGDGRTLLGRETAELLNLLHIGPFQANNVDSRGLGSCIREKYKALFTGIDLLKGYKLKLRIDESVKPVAQPVRRIPLGLWEKVNKKHHIIEEVPVVSSGWISPLVVVLKGDGDMRMCVGMKQSSVKDTRFQLWRSFYTI